MGGQDWGAFDVVDSPVHSGKHAARLLVMPEAGEAQTVAIHPTGATSFDPGAGTFNFFAQFPAARGRIVYGENARNTWEPDASRRSYSGWHFF